LAVAAKANLDRRISAELHHNLGVLYTEEGRLGMARRHIEEAIAIWSEVVPPDNFNLLCGQNSLVYVLLREGRLQQAHDLARQTATAAASLFGARQSLSLTALRNFGYVLARMGRPNEALKTIEQAIPMHEEVYGPESPIVAELLQAYAGLLRKVGRRQDAKQAAKRANAVLSR
jgi:tetratricopeptide (TPR) repeat protein